MNAKEDAKSGHLSVDKSTKKGIDYSCVQEVGKTKDGTASSVVFSQSLDVPPTTFQSEEGILRYGEFGSKVPVLGTTRQKADIETAVPVQG